MEKRLHELEQKVEDLARAVKELQARLEAAPPVLGPSGPLLPEAPLAPLDGTAAVSAVPLAGRSLLVIAGAYVFRLITERELVPRLVGVTLGLAFASLWVLFASRAAKKNDRLSAGFHAGVGALIGYSLLLETGARPGVLTAPASAAVLAGFTGLLLAISWRHKLQELAWLAQVGCAVAAGGLILATDAPLPYLLVLWGLAASTLVFSDLRQWPQLRWPIALFLDLAAVRLVFSLSALTPAEQAGRLWPLVLVTQATVALYIGALALGTWLRKKPVRTFEVAQTVLVLTVGLVATTRVHSAAGPWGLAVAMGALITAVRLAPSADRQFDSGFYGVLALALTLASGPLVLTGAALGLFWAVCAVGLATLGRWRVTALLWGGAALLAWVAAVPAGAAGVLFSGLARAPGAEWAPLTAAAVAVIALPVAGWAAMTVGVKDRAEPVTRGLAAALLGLGALGVVALCGYAMRGWLNGPEASAAGVVLVRTVVFCTLAVALAAAGRLTRLRELGWSAWGLILLSGFKVLVQDLPQGNAGTGVVAFLSLGLAILAVPRLLKRPAASPNPSAHLG